jgi:2',3'-cyclic-nucleotide 2'-phosphodiesterase/3'-nucleotidase
MVHTCNETPKIPLQNQEAYVEPVHIEPQFIFRRPMTPLNDRNDRATRPPGAHIGDEAELRVRILGTSDIHMNLLGHDYHKEHAPRGGGLVHLAQQIRHLRTEAEEEGALCLLFDNGDILQGNPLGDCAIEQRITPHPAMIAFRHLRYDALGLGNHDLDYGMDALARVLADAPCPVISSNLRAAHPDLDRRLARSTVLERTATLSDGTRAGLKIGVCSVLPPQTMQWNAKVFHDPATITDMVQTARATITQLRSAGCGLVVLLAHTGLGPDPARPFQENAALTLTKSAGADVVLAGHTHLPMSLSKPAGGTRAALALPSSAARQLALFDLTLRPTTDADWRVAEATARVVDRETDDRDDILAGLLEPAHRSTLGHLNTPIGISRNALHSYFCFCAPDRSLALIAAAQAAAIRPHIGGSSATRLPVLSAVAPGRFGGRAGPEAYTDIPPGQIRGRHLADLYAYGNDLQALLVTGAQLLDWLEMSASIFNQIPPGTRGTALISADRAGHNFDVLHGLTYEIDLTRPARFTIDGLLTEDGNRRICNARWEGLPIREDQHFVVATNTYRSGGGGHFTALEHACRLPLPALPVRDALRDYIAGRLPRDALETAPDPWRFTPITDSTARLETGPGARKFLDEIAHFDPDVQRNARTGFLDVTLAMSMPGLAKAE